ncbi:MAG: hypothetical protein ACLR8I_11815 [Christensenellaceae bacterium]
MRSDNKIGAMPVRSVRRQPPDVSQQPGVRTNRLTEKCEVMIYMIV